MAVTTWSPGQVLAAQDLNDTFASKLDLAGGKILQIVRATDATERTTTSTSFVDANISVTITPQKSDSALLLIWSGVGFGLRASAGDCNIAVGISDNSNNLLSGASSGQITGNAVSAVISPFTMIGYSTPATTNATTYKGRFRQVSTSGTTATIRNDVNAGQMYALEISA